MGIVVVVVHDHVRLGEATVAYALYDLRIGRVAIRTIGKIGRNLHSSLSLVPQHWKLTLRIETFGGKQQPAELFQRTVAVIAVGPAGGINELTCIDTLRIWIGRRAVVVVALGARSERSFVAARCIDLLDVIPKLED